MLYGWPGGNSPRFRNASKVSEGAGRPARVPAERHPPCAHGPRWYACADSGRRSRCVHEEVSPHSKRGWLGRQRLCGPQDRYPQNVCTVCRSTPIRFREGQARGARGRDQGLGGDGAIISGGCCPTVSSCFPTVPSTREPPSLRAGSVPPGAAIAWAVHHNPRQLPGIEHRPPLVAGAGGVLIISGINWAPSPA